MNFRYVMGYRFSSATIMHYAKQVLLHSGLGNPKFGLLTKFSPLKTCFQNLAIIWPKINIFGICKKSKWFKCVPWPLSSYNKMAQAAQWAQKPTILEYIQSGDFFSFLQFAVIFIKEEKIVRGPKTFLGVRPTIWGSKKIFLKLSIFLNWPRVKNAFCPILPIVQKIFGGAICRLKEYH